MIDATQANDHLLSTDTSTEPMDLSDSSTTGTPPPPSDFPELMAYSTTPSFPIGADCKVLLSPASTVASPPMHHLVKSYAIFPDTSLTNLPSPPNSGKVFYTHWNTHYAMDQGPGPNDDVMIPPEFYMQERCTPDPEPYLGGYPIIESQNQSTISQPAPYFVPVPRLGSNGPSIMRSSSVQSAGSPNTLESSSEVGMPDADLATASIRRPRRPNRRPSASKSADTKTEDDDSEKLEDDLEDELPSSACLNSKSKKKATAKRPTTLRGTVADGEEHKNCLGKLIPPELKEDCPEEERCIFNSRWKHRDKKGQDMWDSIQEDYLREFDRVQCKETLQMKLTRGRSKYIKWLPEDEEILIQAWMNMERDRYKTLLEEFHHLGGSRNMLLNPSDIEVKVVTELRLEEGVYAEGVNETEIRRRCQFLKGGRKVTSRNAKPTGISYSGTSLLDGAVDEDEVIAQVAARQAKGQGPRKGSAGRRKRAASKSLKGPKRVKADSI